MSIGRCGLLYDCLVFRSHGSLDRKTPVSLLLSDSMSTAQWCWWQCSGSRHNVAHSCWHGMTWTDRSFHLRFARWVHLLWVRPRSACRIRDALLCGEVLPSIHGISLARAPSEHCLGARKRSLHRSVPAIDGRPDASGRCSLPFPRHGAGFYDLGPFLGNPAD